MHIWSGQTLTLDAKSLYKHHSGLYVSTHQTYPRVHCFYSSFWLMILMIICNWMLLVQPLGGGKEICAVSFCHLGKLLCPYGAIFSKTMIDLNLVSCFFSVAVLPVAGRGSHLTSLEIADTKQNIVTGHHHYERTLKSNNDWTGLGLWTKRRRSCCRARVKKNRPPRGLKLELAGE